MSSKLPVLRPSEVVRALSRAGFYIHHQSGSHVQLKHATRGELRLTIPFHNRDLPKPVLRSIIRQADMSVEQFLSLL
jgi:predicted RNA binding protein YcfA (HicA-like mRNA interferase family)